MRFDPDHRLPPNVEYWGWRPPRWPAGQRSWRLRRRAGQVLDGLASVLAGLTLGAVRAADLVHGQPMVMIRSNGASEPPRRLNRYVNKTHVIPRAPFAPADLDFLVEHCARMPEARAALDPELLAAVDERSASREVPAC